VELFLRLLGLDFAYLEAPPEVRTTDGFRRLNPLRQIPVLEDGELALPDSNAILVYLALAHDPDGPWLPRDPADAAQVQRWLSISAGEIRYGPARARVIKRLGGAGDLAAAQAIAHTLLSVMDAHLTGRAWLVGETLTLADIACYPYLAVAPEGGVELTSYPAVAAWIARLEALPGLKPMPRAA
jgi:glutathione S-transferase